MSQKAPKYKLRDKAHEVVGTFTETELIKAIESGKYTGEEEIQVSGSSKWQRLASNASFYDAFLKRVHGKEYGFESDQEEVKEELDSNKNENLTEVHSDTTDLKASEKAAKKERGTGLTLRDSEIQSLFKSQSGEKTEVQIEEMQIPSREEDEKSLPQIQMTFNERQNEVRENNNAARNNDRRRIALWGIVLVLVLVSLFNLGQNKESTEITGKDELKKLEESVSQPLNISNEILIQLASYYSAQDTLPGYRVANKILDLGNFNTEKSIDIIRQKTAVLSELIVLERDNADLINQLTTWVSKGREVDPQASDFYRAEAKVLLAAGNYSDAKKVALRAKEANPQDPENALLLSEITLENKDIADSKIYLETIEGEIETSVRKKKILARVNLELQNYRGLESAADACVAISPAHSECYYLLSEGYAKQNQLKKARAFLELAARLSPFTKDTTGKVIFERLVQLEGVLGKEEDVKKYQSLTQLFEKDVTNEIRKSLKAEWEGFVVNDDFLIKRASEQDKNSKSIFKYYVAATSIDPKSREAKLQMGRALEKEINGIEGYQRTEAYYQIATHDDPGFVKAFVRLGATQTEQYNFEKGHSYLLHALQLDDTDPEAYFEMGKHLYKRQDYVSASDMLLKAKQNNFQSDELYYYFGLVRQKLDRSKIRESMEAFYTAYSLNPENYDALSEWLKLKLVANEKAFAIKFLKSLQAADPKNAEVLRVLGEVYLANSEARRAVNYFHRSLDLNNTSSKTRMSLARALESIGELDTAAEEFHEAARIDPKNAEGFYESARVLFQLQNYPKMAVVVKKLQDLSPNYPGSHKLGSLVAQSTGDKEKALSEMKKEVENNPENYSFVIEFAQLYMRFNMFNEAIVELSKITNLPTETSTDKTKAAQYVKVRLTAYYLLSGCYRLLAKPELAEGAAKLGLKVDSENALLRRELCFVYADEQRFPEATRECEYYLRRNPAAEDADRIKQKLKDMNIDYY